MISKYRRNKRNFLRGGGAEPRVLPRAVQNLQ